MKYQYFVKTFSFFGTETLFEFGNFTDAVLFAESSVDARNISHSQVQTDRFRIVHEFWNKNRTPPNPPPEEHEFVTKLRNGN